MPTTDEITPSPSGPVPLAGPPSDEPATPAKTPVWHVLLRLLGAAALFGIAADHFYEYFAESYSQIPTIGTLFLLNGASAIAVALGLILPVGRLLGRRYAGAGLALLALSGIGIAAGSLAGLFVSESTTLFGFMETDYRLSVVLSIVAEFAAIIVLSAFLAAHGKRAIPRRKRAEAKPAH